MAITNSGRCGLCVAEVGKCRERTSQGEGKVKMRKSREMKEE
jgi:hypothetical protein